MSRLRSFFLICLAAVLLAVPAAAQDEDASAPPQEEEETGEEMKVEDVIVVTASRTEQRVHEVPAAITVLTAEDLAQIPADDYGDYLRNVPGLNVSQMSARDIQITGRSATNSLANSDLVLLDNRTLYLDFFGFVMWDFAPIDAKEIKQIEVVRGPGSAVWGANAMTGVINLITKRPREMQGTSITLGGGDFSTLFGNVTHAGVNAAGDVGYKLSAGYYEQEPYKRPTGTIPGTEGPANPGGTQYPAFANQGTAQPKVNLRIDYDPSDSTTMSFSAGYAGTDGIIHSGLGPFDIDTGSQMSFAKYDWSRRAARFTFFVNVLDGRADNLLADGPDGNPIAFDFESQTYNLDFSNTVVVGEKNIFTFGATARRNNFDLSIAPAGDSREEYGAFVQDEILLGDKARWLVGVRWDDIDPIGSVVSPRTSLLISPRDNHTFRLSYNRAFRAPSMINNFLDVTLVQGVLLPPVPPFTAAPIYYVFPFKALGNAALTETQLDAIEVGYVGTFGQGNTLSVALYRNEKTDEADFFQVSAYGPANPPPGFPFPAFLLAPPFPFAGAFPSSFSYRNVGEIIDQGVELSLNVYPSDYWSVFFNYSWQEAPEVSGIPKETLPSGRVVEAIGIPPENRVNFGVAYDGPKLFVNGNLNFVDDAFWTDVLGTAFWGPTDSFTQVNLGAGWRLADDKVTLSINAQNVFDEDVLQHVFGDLIERKISGRLLFRF